MHPPTVLVMDDNPDVRCVLHECLQEIGYSVLTVSDGELGLELALRERPDLLIVDLMMPRKNGFQVVKQFREQSDRPVPVIMISAIGDPRQQAYALSLGAEAYLSKPFTLHQLSDTVEQLCPLPHRSLRPSYPLGGTSLNGSVG